jgi:hypothetical protein
MNDCQLCGGPLVPLGRLGNRDHLTCRDCGMACSRLAEAEESCLTCGRRGCVGFCDEYDLARP